MRKYVYFFAVVVVCALLSLFSVFSLGTDYVYEILDDTAPYSLGDNDNPLISTYYRWNPSTNTWQSSAYGLTNYQDVTGPFNLTDYLISLNLATAADVEAASLTQDDFLTYMNSYFGGQRWPRTLSYRVNGVTGFVEYNSASLSDTLMKMLQIITQNQISDTVYLSQFGGTGSGAVSTSRILGQGLVGLSTFLTGHNSLSNIGVIGNSEATTVGGILSDGFNGLSYNILGHDSAITSKVFKTGSSIPDEIVSASLGNILGLYLPLLNEYILVGPNVPYVDQHGNVLTRGQYLTLGEVIGNGNIALHRDMVGDADDGYSWVWKDYSDPTRTIVHTETNILEAIVGSIGSIQPMLADYMYSHGTDLDIRERENMEEQAEQFVEDFTSPGGKGTPSAGNMSDTAGVSGAIKDAFSGGASPADAFTQITDSGNYGFLSSETQRQLNPFLSTRSFSAHEEVEDRVTPQLNAILGGLGSSW